MDWFHQDRLEETLQLATYYYQQAIRRHHPQTFSLSLSYLQELLRLPHLHDRADIRYKTFAAMAGCYLQLAMACEGESKEYVNYFQQAKDALQVIDSSEFDPNEFAISTNIWQKFTNWLASTQLQPIELCQ